MLFLNKSGCKVSRSSNDIGFVLFQTTPSVGSPFTTICISSTIVDAINGLGESEEGIDSSFRV